MSRPTPPSRAGKASGVGSPDDPGKAGPSRQDVVSTTEQPGNGWPHPEQPDKAPGFSGSVLFQLHIDSRQPERIAGQLTRISRADGACSRTNYKNPICSDSRDFSR
ncbi:hypothetical protein CSOJ01_02086 [Colletotrichum sojae]|uniref:Uncharacterized protein n=1 Tax=Colletotrichum sojae TaxID=2175907 RepID=A0A8H6JRD3_9PEZI|nr:hypothetical protein CSOJ01_02086 [Colletotrichum sojae]